MNRFVVPAVLVLALLVAAPSDAQPTWGVLGGFNSASISDIDDEFADEGEEFDEVGASTGRRSGFKAGVFVNVPVAHSLSVEPAVVYTQAGATIEAPTEDGFGFESKIKIDYVTVPIPIRYDFASNGSMKPFLRAGPYVAFKTSSQIHYDFDIDPAFLSTPADRAAAEAFLQEVFGVGIDGGDTDIDDVKTTDVGLVVGGGVQLNNGLGVGADFSMGFTSINEDDEVSLKNRMFSVYLTLGFGGN